jgi:PhzF family phenazine biosynthesis protein
MKLRMWQVDAFTSRRFSGNPAAVVPLADWLPERTLLDIAAENNLAETAFFVPRNGDFDMRWFTPTVEMDLCGHATLASAWVLFHVLEPARDRVTFHSKGGDLTVTRDGERLAMDFPSAAGTRCDPPHGLAKAIGVAPLETWRARDFMAVVEDEARVRALAPDLAAVAALGERGVIVTAPGREADFVSRFFAPAVGVPEDPVTGSAHCTLVPYWAARLGKNRLRALQLSPRGGELFCELRGDRVGMAGDAVPYLEGTIEV